MSSFSDQINLRPQICKERQYLLVYKPAFARMGKATDSFCQKVHQRMGKRLVLLIDVHINSLQNCFCQTNLSLSKESLMETLAMLYVIITKTDSCTASGRKITSKGLLSPKCEYHDIKSKWLSTGTNTP